MKNAIQLYWVVCFVFLIIFSIRVSRLQRHTRVHTNSHHSKQLKFSLYIQYVCINLLLLFWPCVRLVLVLSFAFVLFALLYCT